MPEVGLTVELIKLGKRVTDLAGELANFLDNYFRNSCSLPLDGAN